MESGPRSRFNRQSLLAISEYAGISERAVDDHLHGRNVLPERASGRVVAAIRDLGLVLDERRPTVGLMIPDLATPFFGELASAVERAAVDRGWELILLPSGGAVSREVDHLARLHSGEVQGLLIATNNGSSSRLSQSIDRQDRIVLINEEIRGQDLPIVSYDNRAGGALIGSYFLDRGFRNVFYIGGPKDTTSSNSRGDGFRIALMGGLGRRPEFRQCFGAYTEDHGYETVCRLARAGRLPEAILAGSDSIAAGAIRALRDLSFNIPTDVSIATIDGTGLLAFLVPSIVSVRVPVEELAQRAMVTLLGTQVRSGRRVRVTLPVALVEGSSVRDLAA